MPVGSLGWEDPLEKEMAAHFSILAWRIPQTQEPDRLQSIGSPRVRHNCWRKGNPFYDLRVGSYLTLGNELSKETHVLTKQEILLGKSTQVESNRVREPRRTVLPSDLQSGFMVIRLVSGWSLANHSNSESFLVAHASFSQDGCQQEGFWEVDGHAVSPFDPSPALLVGGGLLVPYSSSGFPVIKQLM